MKKYRVVKIEPNKPAYETFIEDGLKPLQDAVEGYIEITYPFDEDVYLVGNEEAKLIGLKGNRRIGGAIYAGNLLIVGDDGEGGSRDLTDDEVKKFVEMFKEPENIDDDEVQNDVGFTVIGWY